MEGQQLESSCARELYPRKDDLACVLIYSGAQVLRLAALLRHDYYCYWRGKLNSPGQFTTGLQAGRRYAGRRSIPSNNIKVPQRPR